jgi:hypothetical protein
MVKMARFLECGNSFAALSWIIHEKVFDFEQEAAEATEKFFSVLS